MKWQGGWGTLLNQEVEEELRFGQELEIAGSGWWRFVKLCSLFFNMFEHLHVKIF